MYTHIRTYVWMDRRANKERVGYSYVHMYVEKDLAEDVGTNLVWISRVAKCVQHTTTIVHTASN